MKKISLIFLSLTTVVFTLFSFVGCKDKKGQSGENTPTVEMVELTETSIELVEGSVGLVEYKVNGKVVFAEWISKDETVAEVNKYGNVIAKSAGTAELVATYNGKSLSCNVTVLETDDYPVLFLGRTELEIKIDKTFKLSPYVIYKGESITSCSFLYSVEDETVISVENDGTVTAKKGGTTTVSVQSEYKGALLEKELFVSVKEDLSLHVSATSVQLYATALSAEQKTTKQVTAELFIGGQQIEGFDLSWETDDENVATVSNGLITAEGRGNTNVYAVYTSDSGAKYKNKINVDVVTPVISSTQNSVYDLTTDWDMSLLTGDFSLFFNEEITGITVKGEKNSLDFVQTGTKVKINPNGRVLGGNYVLAIETPKITIELPTLIVTKIITTTEEFKNLSYYGGLTDEKYAAENRDYYGYFMLGANLDFKNTNNSWMENRRIGFSYDGAYSNGFHGVFDGQGYSISNIDLSYFDGLFGGVHSDATIKNVAFKNITLSQTGGIFGRECCGTLENVFIDVNFKSGVSGAGALGYYVSANKLGGIKNVVIVAHGTVGEGSGVLVANQFTYRDQKINNVYVITGGMKLFGLATNDYLAYNFTVGTSSVTATGLDASIWDTTGDYPVMLNK